MCFKNNSSKRLRTGLGRAGFSLMEMLVVSAILPVIFFSVFANMSSGLRAWKTFNRPVSEEGTVIFLDRVRSDFSSAFAYTDAPFTGDAERLSFAAPIQASQRLGGDRGIGRIGYRYDSSSKSILREESNVSELFKESPPRARSVLSGVSAFYLEYLSYQPAESSYVWAELWQPGKRPLPAAVRMTIDRVDGERLVQTFMVPGGN